MTLSSLLVSIADRGQQGMTHDELKAMGSYDDAQDLLDMGLLTRRYALRKYWCFYAVPSLMRQL